MSDLNYHRMELKFGPSMAYQVLTHIEKAAGIRSFEVIELDPETRLTKAIEAQDAKRRILPLAA